MKDWGICEYMKTEDVYMDIKKWRQLHIMLTLLQKNEQYESNWENQFRCSTSDVKCKFKKRFPTFFETYMFSEKETSKIWKGNLISTHSENTEHRLQLNIYSSMSEHLKFNNEGKTHNITNLRDPWAGDHFILPPTDIFCPFWDV